MPEFPDHAQLPNLEIIEDLYHRYRKNPKSVDSSWRYFFEGIDFSSCLQESKTENRSASPPSSFKIYELIDSFRRYGHLSASFNPLKEIGGGEKGAFLDLEKRGFSSSERKGLFPSLGFCSKKEAPLDEILSALQAIYCNRIGFEYMDLGNQEMEEWIQGKIEPALSIDLPIEEKRLLLEGLNRSEIFESFLHSKYPGQTRFSLEGAETMIPLIAEWIDFGSGLGIEEVFIGMAHRGRLNVLVNILNKPLSSIFAEFEDDTNLSFPGSDDVRYHMGFSGEFIARSHRKVKISMAANPSHLESVDPVVLGQTFARQFLEKDREKTKIVPLLIHGDASVAGQGVIYESLQLMNLSSYSVGGTIHLVVNNQIGYTTLPQEGRSTRYCTDIAKAFGCPVFHVNAEDPESCLYAAKLALEIRQKFHSDVFIDLYSYRKYGHNEGDEPSFTQPRLYEIIRAKKGIRQMYLERLLSEGKLERDLGEALEADFRQKMKEGLQIAQETKGVSKGGGVSEEMNLFEPFSSGVDLKGLEEVLGIFCKIPEGFRLHPKLQKWVKNRLGALKGEIDWATGECLAFGTLLREGISIRLAGQDSQRGTFSQRHMVWIDSETETPYCPFAHFENGSFQIINSPLTEYAGMGFEYGYTWGAPDSFVLWEAQYGDFNNGAEIIIDQYLSSAEQKWNCPSSLTLLLPHGYEGAGPEHSSARIERFLQLSANRNLRIANPSTPAQYFHLLRRQALQKEKKPLIVFTPKSLLRSPACTSRADQFLKGSFEEILDDPAPPIRPKRLVFCSGKIFYDLLAARKNSDTALIRIEQLYPLHLEKIEEIFNRHRGFSDCFWVQEEPKNMGAWNYIAPYLRKFAIKLDYAGRPENATTATGSNIRHKQEQAALLQQAFGDR